MNSSGLEARSGRGAERLRFALLLATAWMVAGCGSIGGGDVGSMYEIAKRLWQEDSGISRQEASAVPYASIGLRIGNSNEIMLILASDQNGTQLWTSGARIAVTTKNGRIIRSAGFEHSWSVFGPRSESMDAKGRKTVDWLADFSELKLFAVPIHCIERPGSGETIEILGAKIQTERLDELCEARSRHLDWTFRNIYWLDPTTGFVWRSAQHVNPKLDVLHIEVLRPPIE